MSLLLLRDSPVDLGLRAQGLPANSVLQVSAHQASEKHWSFAEALRAPAFWLLMAAGLCSLYTLRLVTVHQVAHFVDRGVSRATAATVFGSSGLITAASYIGFGLLSDRIGRERAFYLGAVAQAVALAMLLGLSGDSPPVYLYTYALLWGVGEGSRSGLLTSIVSDRFAGSQLGTIVGTLGAFFGLGAAVGSWAGGLIFDGVGSYTPAFLSALVATSVACACVAIARAK
jgi:MFS family permease